MHLFFSVSPRCPGWSAVARGALGSVSQGFVQLTCCCGNTWHHLSFESAACLPMQTAATSAEGKHTDTNIYSIYLLRSQYGWATGRHWCIGLLSCTPHCRTHKQPCWCQHGTRTNCTRQSLLSNLSVFSVLQDVSVLAKRENRGTVAIFLSSLGHISAVIYFWRQCHLFTIITIIQYHHYSLFTT